MFLGLIPGHPQTIRQNILFLRVLFARMEPDLERVCFSPPTVNGFGKKTFAFQGCKLLNDLPTNNKSIARNQSLKVAVKAHCLNLL